MIKQGDFMNKFMGLFFVLTLTFSAFANARISDELAVVKASQDALENNVDLNTINGAKVSDTNGVLEVELKYTNGHESCTILSWFKHSGKVTSCEPCQGQQVCLCAKIICSLTSDPSEAIIDYLSFN